jgi:hypothetical protein
MQSGLCRPEPGGRWGSCPPGLEDRSFVPKVPRIFELPDRKSGNPRVRDAIVPIARMQTLHVLKRTALNDVVLLGRKVECPGCAAKDGQDSPSEAKVPTPSESLSPKANADAQDCEPCHDSDLDSQNSDFSAQDQICHPNAAADAERTFDASCSQLVLFYGCFPLKLWRGDSCGNVKQPLPLPWELVSPALSVLFSLGSNPKRTREVEILSRSNPCGDGSWMSVYLLFVMWS